MTYCAILSRGDFTQTDPWTRPAGSTTEAGYVYTGNNPMAYVDLSGMCRSSTMRQLNSIARMDSTPPTTVSNGGKTDCPSLFQNMVDLVQAIKGPGQGMKGLEKRWFGMMRDGVLGGRTPFDRHVAEFYSQQHGGNFPKKTGALRKKWNLWLKDCDDPNDPPSSIDVRQLQKIEEWTMVNAPTWEDVNDALVLSQKNYQAANGSPGPRPTKNPISVPWQKIAIGAGIVVVAGSLAVAVGLGLGVAGAAASGGGGGGGGLAWPGPPA